MDALAPYRVTVIKTDGDGRQTNKEVSRCPVCATENSLREAKGMILCNHCFWALELRQAG